LSQSHHKETYVEVIGDTVYGKHLMMTIIISVSLSLAGFFLGREVIFLSIAPEEMIQSYSLLVGIAGSLSGLIVNALLFKPKRTLNEKASTSDELSSTYEKMQLDINEERESILHDPVTAQEMKEQGFYDMFINEQENTSDKKVMSNSSEVDSQDSTSNKKEGDQ